MTGIKARLLDALDEQEIVSIHKDALKGYQHPIGDVSDVEFKSMDDKFRYFTGLVSDMGFESNAEFRVSRDPSLTVCVKLTNGADNGGEWHNLDSWSE